MDLSTHKSVDIDDRNDKPLISIVLTFLNAEKYFVETLESVFAQSYEEWELLLIDDGSSDRSTQIALDYAARHPDRVRYLEHDGHENLGMSASRNLGVREAKGEYVAFLDADDVWLPEKLEEQEAVMRRQPEAAMVYGATEYWYSWTGNPDDRQRDYIPALGIRPDRLVQPPALFPVLLRNQIVTSTNSLVRRAAIDSLGGFEPSFRGLHEDQAFFAKMSLAAPIFVTSQCGYKYRRHPDSCCAVEESAGRHHAKRISFLNWVKRYLRERGKDADAWAEVWQALDHEVWKARHPFLSRLQDARRYQTTIMKERLKALIRRRLPDSLYHWLRVRRHGSEYRPAVGKVNYGGLRRLTPISQVFGYDRGKPVDRYYIENFIARHSQDIRGRVLEVGDDAYTRAFGGDRVTRRDVLHVQEGSPQATIIADLTRADHIPSAAFDCIILTQTLHLIYDVRAAMATLHRILKPGGVLLATVPGISQIDHDDWGESWYWAFTTLSARRLFAEMFVPENVTVESHGNVFAAISFLHGVSQEEVSQKELDYQDTDFQVTITVRAKKEGRP